MGDIKPKALLELINRERLDDLDKVVYDGTRRFVDLVETLSMAVVTSGNYQLRCIGKTLGVSSYFAFAGQQGVVLADYLRPVGNELLAVARDKELMEIIKDAEGRGLRTSIPITWAGARHMNTGLYEEAAQFEIEPPCLRIGTNCKPEEFMGVVENLAEVNKQLYDLQVKRMRGE